MSRPLPEIWLTTRDNDLLTEWKKKFSDVSGIKVVLCEDITDVIPDCKVVVSPAQSFGVMDGGLDLAYSVYFGWDLQERLRETIRTNYYGELLVGQYCLVPIDENQKLLSVPTMRVPQLVANTTNAYMAFRAVLIACIEENLEGPVICPGLCVGVGRMSPELCAKQMRMAWDSISKVGSGVMGLKEAVRHELRLREPDIN